MASKRARKARKSSDTEKAAARAASQPKPASHRLQLSATYHSMGLEQKDLEAIEQMFYKHGHNAGNSVARGFA